MLLNSFGTNFVGTTVSYICIITVVGKITFPPRKRTFSEWQVAIDSHTSGDTEL
jgi:hypothetical protein